MIANLHLFMSTMLVHAASTIKRPFYRIVLFIQPIVIATTMHMIYRDAAEEEVARFILLGGGLAGIWSAMTFSTAGDVERERLQGVFSALIAAPASLAFVFTAKIVMNTGLALLALVITVLYSWLVLGVHFVLPHPVAFVVALSSFLFGTGTFALFLANIFLLTRTAWVFQNVLESPLLILGGVAFPVTILPSWARVISVVLPIRWGSDALYAALSVPPPDGYFWQCVAWTLLTGALYGCLAQLLFRYIEYRVRWLGNLETV
jgi:ABC-2 type transport system permease protein